MHRTRPALAAIAAVAALTALPVAPAHGLTGADLLDCNLLDQAACPALKLALANPTPAIDAARGVLASADAPAARVRKAGIALGILLGPKAAAELLRAGRARPAGSELRIELLGAAARAGAKEAAQELRAALSNDSPRARIIAAGALAVLEDKASAPKLRALLADKQPHVVSAAAQALATVGSAEDADALLALAAAPRSFAPARRNALVALARIAPQRALSTAARLIDHPTRSIGRAALDVIAAAPQGWTSPLIAFGLKTPGLRGRAAMAAAACKVLDRQVLVAALALDLSASERTWVLHALGKLKPMGAGMALMGRLDKLPEPAQIAVLKTLSSLGDKTVVPALIDKLGSASPSVANYVVYALENVTGQRLGSDLAAWQRYAKGEAPPSAGAAPTPEP